MDAAAVVGGALRPRRALKLCRESAESVRSIGRWCSEQGVDAWFTPGGYVMASTAPAHDAILDEIVAAAPPDRVRALSAGEVRARCDSPRFRRGLLVADDATVQPARLALGLRDRLRDVIRERSRVTALRVAPEGVTAETAGGRVHAGAAVLAMNAATRGVPPLRNRLSVTSSHIVLTEPVPDVLEELGWSGGECITDARTFVHYFRTTRDGRIAFGWGGGRLAAGARLGGKIEVDPEVATETHAHLVDMFPQLEGRAITARVGRPDRRLAFASAADRDAPGRARPLRVRLHRQRRRPLPPRRPRPRGAGEWSLDRPRVRRSRARHRTRRALGLRGRNARPPRLFT